MKQADEIILMTLLRNRCRNRNILEDCCRQAVRYGDIGIREMAGIAASLYDARMWGLRIDEENRINNDNK